MDRVVKIQYTQNLRDDKEKIEKELDNINLVIKNNQDTCSQHIGICSVAGYSSCLICGKALSSREIFKLSNSHLIVYANDCIRNTKNWKNDMENMEIMFLGFCKMHPEMSDTEIVAAFNELINSKQESEEKIEESKPVTKHLSNRN